VRRSTVLSLPLMLVFPGLTIRTRVLIQPPPAPDEKRRNASFRVPEVEVEVELDPSGVEGGDGGS